MEDKTPYEGPMLYWSDYLDDKEGSTGRKFEPFCSRIMPAALLIVSCALWALIFFSVYLFL